VADVPIGAVAAPKLRLLPRVVQQPVWIVEPEQARSAKVVPRCTRTEAVAALELLYERTISQKEVGVVYELGIVAEKQLPRSQERLGFGVVVLQPSAPAMFVPAEPVLVRSVATESPGAERSFPMLGPPISNQYVWPPVRGGVLSTRMGWPAV
jgi:hypothetical protein